MIPFKKTITRILIPLLLVILPFITPPIETSFNVDTILTVVSLVFAILAGFFIATATTNYLRLQSLISGEDSCLINIFNLTKVIQPSSVEKMRQVIDYYSTRTLDFYIKDYVNATQREFREILKTVDELEPQNEKGLELLQNLYNKRDEFLKNRQEINLAAQNVVMFQHWVILGFLAALIIGLLLAMGNGSFLFSFITILLSLATYLILSLLYDIDNNTFLEEQLAYQNSQIIFTELGTLKYFPSNAMHKRRVKKPMDEDFRVGKYKGVWGYSEREIVLIKKDSLNGFKNDLSQLVDF